MEGGQGGREEGWKLRMEFDQGGGKEVGDGVGGWTLRMEFDQEGGKEVGDGVGGWTLRMGPGGRDGWRRRTV